jgi:arylsulfatase A-like enzyme
VVGYDFLPTFYDLAGGRGELTAEIDGVSIRPLFRDPETSIDRPEHALFFHRPLRQSSAIRQGKHKLMLFWKPDGTMRSRELYYFNPDPREQGRNITDQEPAKADELEALLRAYLKSVDAEQPGAIPRQQNRKRAGR